VISSIKTMSRKKKVLIGSAVVFTVVVALSPRAADTQPTSAAVAPTATPEAAAPSGAPAPEPAPAQQNALRSAENYLRWNAFSRQGLIDQLSSEYGSGYSVEDAAWAADNIGVDWNEQAVRSANSYLELSSFSRQALIEQLSSEHGSKYTLEQATHAVNTLGL
jgi:hypothetical protein